MIFKTRGQNAPAPVSYTGNSAVNKGTHSTGTIFNS